MFSIQKKKLIGDEIQNSKTKINKLKKKQKKFRQAKIIFLQTRTTLA